MPGFDPSMPSIPLPCECVLRRAGGTLAQQRAALSGLIAESGWTHPTKEDSGRPRMGPLHCSLSHGGGWVAAARGPKPVGIDVEGATDRLVHVRRRFVGEADQPVIDHFGDDLNTLCRLWTAKEAVFKAFGTEVDFLTGIRWNEVQADGAHLTALRQQQPMTLRWTALDSNGTPVWLAIAVADSEQWA